MHETAQESWFYSIDGERAGPVSLGELRALAKEGRLNPRLDMVWVQGMPDWQPAGEVAGLFDRRENTPGEEAMATGEAYTTTRQDAAAEMMGREMNWPGARRRSYLFAAIFFPLLWFIGLSFATPLINRELPKDVGEGIVLGASFVPALVFLLVSLSRLVNVGMSRWWFLGNFVPLVNLWVGYRCFACPAGYAFHKKMDGAGIFLAIIYWLLVLVGLAVIAGFVAVMLGAAGDPELQERLREIIEEARAATPR